MTTYPDDSSQYSQVDTHYDNTLNVNPDPCILAARLLVIQTLKMFI